MKSISIASGLLVLLLSNRVTAFTTTTKHQRLSSSTPLKATAENVNTWINLVPDNDAAPVQKMLLEAATDSEKPAKGSAVTIEYTASLWMNSDDALGCSIPAWDTNAVIDCWLSEQQGLSDILAGPFEEFSVDGSKLLDETIFTEGFVADELGVDNKIRCKKTIMAAKRLRTTMAEYEHGLVFDSTDTKADKVYKFVLGAGKTIKAMELLVASMEIGETSRVVTRCDYGYGADGCRTSKGDVLVPPFCGLQFDVKLVAAE